MTGPTCKRCGLPTPTPELRAYAGRCEAVTEKEREEGMRRTTYDELRELELAWMCFVNELLRPFKWLLGFILRRLT